ncbi:MAG: PIN domain-containing protein [Chloroflexota bacterium]|nr:PIN domain-containing protein [Chloroflexota bacterium]
MHGTVVVDASVWTSRLVAHDVNHSDSLLWLSQYVARGGQVLAPEFLVIEVIAAVARQAGLSHSAKRLIPYLYYHAAIQFLTLDTQMVRRTAAIAADLRLKAGDAIYVAVAEQTSSPLVSLDNQQLQRASSLVETYTPGNYPF